MTQRSAEQVVLPPNAGAWAHDVDNTPCPTFYASRPNATTNGLHWWCTDHQQHVHVVGTEAVEDLEFAYPDCTVCDDGKGDMNTSGDGWWCESCGTTWRRNGMGGRRG